MTLVLIGSGVGLTFLILVDPRRARRHAPRISVLTPPSASTGMRTAFLWRHQNSAINSSMTFSAISRSSLLYGRWGQHHPVVKADYAVTKASG